MFREAGVAVKRALDQFNLNTSAVIEDKPKPLDDEGTTGGRDL